MKKLLLLSAGLAASLMSMESQFPLTMPAEPGANDLAAMQKMASMALKGFDELTPGNQNRAVYRVYQLVATVGSFAEIKEWGNAWTHQSALESQLSSNPELGKLYKAAQASGDENDWDALRKRMLHLYTDASQKATGFQSARKAEYSPAAFNALLDNDQTVAAADLPKTLLAGQWFLATHRARLVALGATLPAPFYEKKK